MYSQNSSTLSSNLTGVNSSSNDSLPNLVPLKLNQTFAKLSPTKSLQSTSNNDDIFVELKGTFVPYEQFQPFKSVISSMPLVSLPLYSSPEFLKLSSNGIIEITGTLLPPSVSLSFQSDNLVSSRLYASKVDLSETTQTTSPAYKLIEETKRTSKDPVVNIHQLNMTATRVPTLTVDNERIALFTGINGVNNTIYNFLLIADVLSKSNSTLNKSDENYPFRNSKPVLAIHELEQVNSDHDIVKKHVKQHEVTVNVNKDSVDIIIPKSLSKLIENGDLIFGSASDKDNMCYDVILLKSSTMRIKYDEQISTRILGAASKAAVVGFRNRPQFESNPNESNKFDNDMRHKVDNLNRNRNISKMKNDELQINVLVNITNKIPDNVVIKHIPLENDSHISSFIWPEESKTIKSSKIKTGIQETGLLKSAYKNHHFVAYGLANTENEDENLEKTKNRSSLRRSEDDQNADSQVSSGLQSVASIIRPSYSELVTRTVHRGDSIAHYDIDSAKDIDIENIPLSSLSTPQLPLNSNPVYEPRSIEHKSSNTIMSGDDHFKSSNTQILLDTTTIFGFLDFTTTISGTKMIFSPKTNAYFQHDKQQQQHQHRASSSFILFPSKTLHSKASMRTRLNIGLVESDKLFNIEPSKSVKDFETIESQNVIFPKSRPGKYESINFNPFKSNKTRLNNPSLFPPMKHNQQTGNNNVQLESVKVPNFLISSTINNLPTGLISSLYTANTLDNSITEWTTLVYGTFIQGTYAHILQTKSRTYEKLTTSKSVPFSSQVINDHTTKSLSVKDTFKRPTSSLSKMNIIVNPSASIVIPQFSSSLASRKTGQITITSGFILPSESISTYMQRTTVLKSSTYLMENDATNYLNLMNRSSLTSIADSNSINTSTISPGLVTSSLITSSFTSVNVATPPLTSNMVSDNEEGQSMTNNQPQKVKSSSESSQFLENKTSNLFKFSESNLNSASLGKEKLLTSFTYTPIRAHITTYTYYTTYFKDGAMLVSSHKETVTNTEKIIQPSLSSSFSGHLVSSSTDNYNENERQQLKPHLQSSFTVSPSSLKQLPLTYYETYTYYTTFFNDGKPTIKSREEIVPRSSYQQPEQSISPTSSIKFSKQSSDVYSLSLFSSMVKKLDPKLQKTSIIRPSKTAFTTYTYYTTYLRGGSKSVVSRLETHTNIIPDDGRDSTATSVDNNNYGRIKPTATTHFTTFTFYTTYVSAGKTHVSTSKKTISNVVTLGVMKPSRISMKKSSKIDINLKPTATHKPETITFTYYTTSINRGKPTVTTRFETVTTMLPEIVTAKESLLPSSLASKHATFEPSRMNLMPTRSFQGRFRTSLPKNRKPAMGLDVVGFERTPLLPLSTTNNAPPHPRFLNQSLAHLNQLLSGVRVPITHYTTYTYFTTLGMPGGVVTTIARTQVVSNIFTDTIKIGATSASELGPTSARAFRARIRDGLFTRLYRRQPLIDDMDVEADEHKLLHSAPPNRFKSDTILSPTSKIVIKIEPSLVHAEEVTRPMSSGDKEQMKGHPELKLKSSKIDLKSSASSLQLPGTNLVNVESKITTYKTRKDDPFLTYETLLTYKTTYFDGRKPAISTRKETKTEIKQSGLINPSITKKPLIIRRTRIRANNNSPFYARKSVILPTKKSKSVNEITKVEGSSSAKSAKKPAATQIKSLPSILPFEVHGLGVAPSPVTFYTTYTRFTTELINGLPIVRSREEIRSSVVRDEVLPTRATIGLRSQPLPSSFDHYSLPLIRFKRQAKDIDRRNNDKDASLFINNSDDLLMEESSDDLIESEGGEEVVLLINSNHSNRQINLLSSSIREPQIESSAPSISDELVAFTVSNQHDVRKISSKPSDIIKMSNNRNLAKSKQGKNHKITGLYIHLHFKR